MARKTRDMQRDFRSREPIRAPYDVVLIVCEGKVTEPDYFNGLRQVLRLSSVNVTAVGSEWGSDPMSVVKYAESQVDGHGYDKVYCVFDRDTHANFDEAVRHVTNSAPGKQGKLVAFTSVPCFEVWLLLHFEYSSTPFKSVGSSSACSQVSKRLQPHLPGYEKGLAKVFERLSGKIDDAVAHAKRLRRESSETGSTNPLTSVHSLVATLQKLKG